MDLKGNGGTVNENDNAAQQNENEQKAEQNAEQDNVQSLMNALADASDERDDLKEKYQRTFSEFNNYKKRTLASRSEAFKDGQNDVIEKMLPVLDSFACAFEHLDEESSENALSQGFLMVCRQLNEVLEKLGVKEIDALGAVFDPNLHQAVQTVETEDEKKQDTVAQVVQKGYLLGDKVLRHSMVIVNK